MMKPYTYHPTGNQAYRWIAAPIRSDAAAFYAATTLTMQAEAYPTLLNMKDNHPWDDISSHCNPEDPVKVMQESELLAPGEELFWAAHEVWEDKPTALGFVAIKSGPQQTVTIREHILRQHDAWPVDALVHAALKSAPDDWRVSLQTFRHAGLQRHLTALGFQYGKTEHLAMTKNHTFATDVLTMPSVAAAQAAIEQHNPLFTKQPGSVNQQLTATMDINYRDMELVGDAGRKHINLLKELTDTDWRSMPVTVARAETLCLLGEDPERAFSEPDIRDKIKQSEDMPVTDTVWQNVMHFLMGLRFNGQPLVTTVPVKNQSDIWMRHLRATMPITKSPEYSFSHNPIHAQ